MTDDTRRRAEATQKEIETLTSDLPAQPAEAPVALAEAEREIG